MGQYKTIQILLNSRSDISKHFEITIRCQTYYGRKTFALSQLKLYKLWLTLRIL